MILGDNDFLNLKKICSEKNKKCPNRPKPVRA
jgi:hypothetical protein